MCRNPITLVLLFIVSLVLACLYTYPNTPKFSIAEFSVPYLNKTSDHAAGDIYLDLKLRNMNKAIGLYYDDPFSLAVSYYPPEDPYQKYAWVCTVPAFYQGNGKTKHIRTLMGDSLQQQSTVVVDEEDNLEPIKTGGDFLAPTMAPLNQGNGEIKHARSLLRNHLQLPSSMVGVDKVDPPAELVKFKIDLVVNYRFRLWGDSSSQELEVGADVMVDANSGERVSTGDVELVKSAAATAGPVLYFVIFTSVLIMSA